MRIIVGFAAGGAADILARLMGQWLSERLGQPFVIENRPGAGSNIGTEAVVRAPPDGYTLLLVASANAINATLYDKLNFNFIRDIAPVASIIRVAPRHGGASIGSGQNGSRVHRLCQGQSGQAQHGLGAASEPEPIVAGELFKMMAGVDMVHVPYRGGAPALTDLLGGQVQVMFATTVASIEYIRAGRLRALAVTTATRSEALPDIPTVGEFVPGYEASVCARHRRTQEHARRDRRQAQQGDQRRPRRSQDEGAACRCGRRLCLRARPPTSAKLIADETEKWGKVIKFANIKPE